MKIHALTLSFNGAHHLEKMIPSLFSAALKTPYPIRLYIRDNGSVDGTKQLIDSYGMTTPVGTIQYYNVGHNRDNYSQGNNFLFKKVKEGGAQPNDVLLFLNNDIIIKDELSLKKMIDLFDDNVGIVGTKLLYPNGKIQHAGVVFGSKYGCFPYHRMRGEKDNKKASINREFQAVTFACAMVKVQCMEDLPGHGLDENYHWCFEDISCNLSVCKMQRKKVLYCGTTNIIHNESETLKHNPINKLFQAHNFSLFKKMWFDKIDIDG